MQSRRKDEKNNFYQVWALKIMEIFDSVEVYGSESLWGALHFPGLASNMIRGRIFRKVN